jgi:hypothetical protein
MGGFVSRPKPPAPPPVAKPQPPKPTTVETSAAQAADAPSYGTDLAVKRKGRRATILTGPSGATNLGGTNVAKKTLLGV